MQGNTLVQTLYVTLTLFSFLESHKAQVGTSSPIVRLRVRGLRANGSVRVQNGESCAHLRALMRN